MELSTVKEFADLSEQELDRIETLVQNLLKITRLDAGAIVLEKATENVADMIRDIEAFFSQSTNHVMRIICRNNNNCSLRIRNSFLIEYNDSFSFFYRFQFQEDYGNDFLVFLFQNGPVRSF